MEGSKNHDRWNDQSFFNSRGSIVRAILWAFLIIAILLLGLSITGYLLNRSQTYNSIEPKEIGRMQARQPDVNEILRFFKDYDSLVKKDDLVGLIRLFSKPYREAFNNRSLQERLLILSSMKMWGGGFTDCETTVKNIEFQDNERSIGRIMVRSLCRNPSTGKRVEQEMPMTLVKEEDGWKLDMVAFMQDFDEKLKAK